jgi:hypothetical protein
LTHLYDIVTCDWNAEQTRIWRHYVEKNCPDANIVTVPDEKPVPWCWSGGKLNCFRDPSLFRTDRIIYLDTDTIVTEDLGFVFKEMGRAKIGLSHKIEVLKIHIRKKDKVRALAGCFAARSPLEHPSSGMIILKGTSPRDLYDGWFGVMEYRPFVRQFKGFPLADEASLMFWVSSYFLPHEVWDIPLQIHANLRKKGHLDSGGRNVPSVIHYHAAKRLISHGLGGYLRV